MVNPDSSEPIHVLREDSLERLIHSRFREAFPNDLSLEDPSWMDVPFPPHDPDRTFRDFLEETRETGFFGFASRETVKSDVLFRYWIRTGSPAPSPLTLVSVLIRELGSLAGLGDPGLSLEDSLLDLVETIALDAILVLLSIRADLELNFDSGRES